MNVTPKPGPPSGAPPIRPEQRTPGEAEAAVAAALSSSGWIAQSARIEPAHLPDGEETRGERLHGLADRLRAAADSLGGDVGRQLGYAADNMRSAARLAPDDGDQDDGAEGAFRAFLVSAEAYVDQARRVRPYELRGEVPAHWADS